MSKEQILWLAVRRGIMMITSALDAYFGVPKR